MIGLLTIAGIALLALRKNRGVSGIGESYKRRVYREIENIQHVANLELPYDAQSLKAKQLIDSECEFVNSKYPKRKPLTSERYYNQLRRAYNAISGVGATNLPYRKYEVFNNRGDLILEHHDYGTKQEMFKRAVEYLEESRMSSYEDLGFWETVIAIATGTRFVWTSSESHRGIEKLVFGSQAPKERKTRISYLASQQKGGIYPEAFAHSIWETIYDGNADDKEITDGVLEAFRTIESVKQAKDMIIEHYINEHMLPDEEFPDTPF